MQAKKCIRCEKEKPVSEFYTSRSSKDGFRNPCKQCLSVEYKIYNEKDYTSRTKRILRNQELASTGVLECSDCNTIKLVEEFYIRPEYKIGYSPRCKDCANKLEEKRRESRRKRYGNNPAPKEKECTCCHEIKPVKCFSKDYSRSDQLSCWCKDCSARNTREQRRSGMNLSSSSSKTCSKCKTNKPVVDFRIKKNSPDGCVSWCISCEKEYRLKHQSEFPNARKMAHRIFRYGVTGEQYDNMLKSQNGVCAICGNPESTIVNGKPKSLSIDHSHLSGQVRQLLCDDCNVAIGRLHDSPELAEKAAAYLRKHQ